MLIGASLASPISLLLRDSQAFHEGIFSQDCRLGKSILTLVRRQYTPALPEHHVFPR